MVPCSRAAMCAAVSMPPGEARSHNEPFECKLGGDLAGEFLPDRRAVVRADNGDDGNIGEIEPALDIKQRRRCIDLGKRRWIARLADGNQARSESMRRLEFSLGFGLAA
jgi:hypothetical protein